MRYVNLVPPRSCRAGSPLSPLLLSLPPRHEHPLLSQVLSRSTVAGWILTLFHLSIFSSRRERERDRETRGGECRLYAFGHSTPHSIPLDCHEERTISFFRIPLPVHRAPLAPLTSPSPFPSPLYVFLRNMKFLRALPYSLAKDRESYKASRSSVLPPPRAGISSAAALASGSFD